MTNYYIEKDDKILLHDQDKQLLIFSWSCHPHYDAAIKIKETERPIVEAENGFVFADSEEYKAKEFANAKEQKLLDNKAALEQKVSFNTNLGIININTPIGRVDVMANGFLNLVNITKSNLPEGAFRIYDANGVEQPSPELTPVQVGEFYVEVFNKFNEIDKRYKQIENAIKEADSLESLEAIELDYGDI